MPGKSGHLLVLGCSATKVASRGNLPALELYDGSNFRVLRKFLRDCGWPPGLIVKILSAKYGLIDVTRIIEPYDIRFTASAAARRNKEVLSALKALGQFESVFVNLGKDYRPAIRGLDALFVAASITHVKGGIGLKMKAMKRWLACLPGRTASLPGRRLGRRPYLYFFPDWDDYVYEPFTPNETKELRASGAVKKMYAHQVFGGDTPYDGLLVSLAQLTTGKGVLGRNSHPNGCNVNLRRDLRLPRRLLLFGDCGAFSYANAPHPPFTPAEAAGMYDRFGFEFGASVDHIPLREITVRDKDGNKTKRVLSDSTRRRRLQMTIDNAAEFLRVCRANAYTFTPMGVVQGMGIQSYARCVNAYMDMGYTHIALGGLVPRRDEEILAILCAVREAVQCRTRQERENIWLHMFGILRPKLQRSFRALGVSSFDSASYLRKAWLRSDQNYLAPEGDRWFGSIRVPISTSKRMREAGMDADLEPAELAVMEKRCLDALRGFDGTEEAIQEVLDSVDAYGPLLQRRGEENHFHEKHVLALTDRPWERCRCALCRAAGIDVAVFRGANRNKRRGLHNTWVLYHRILHGGCIPTSAHAGTHRGDT